MKSARLAAVAVAITAPLLLASAASASTHHNRHHKRHHVSHSVAASTRLLNRDDSGGNGNWAIDTITRVVVVRSLGKAAASNCAGNSPCYAYDASLTDNGSFRAVKGAFTPNQGAPFTGDTISQAVSGVLNGSGQWGTFYATAKPDAGRVPWVVNGDADSTSTWPQLFFPANTTYGVNLGNDWAWFYHTGPQHWTDSAANGDGQTPPAGNIS